MGSIFGEIRQKAAELWASASAARCGVDLFHVGDDVTPKMGRFLSKNN
jgi:hypothetical protein